MKKTLLLALLYIFTSLAFASERPLPYFEAQDLTPYWEQSGKIPAELKSLKVVDQQNRPVKETDFEGQISLVNFFFADCISACPIMMHSLQTFQKHLSGVKIFSFSIQPERDRPERLQTYAKERGLSLKNWRLLTGSREEIYRVGREIFKADGSIGPVKAAFIHTTNIYLLDQKRRIRGIYDSKDDKAMALLAQDIERLKEEKPQL